MENKQFFDPYNFNNMQIQPNPTISQIPDINSAISMPEVSPKMFYEQQFWYYSYLTKMLEYKIKLKEYENMNKKQN